MKQEIKERIEKIKKGEIPEGYKKINNSIFPKDWHYKKIIDIAPLQRGFDLPSYEIENGKYPVCYSNGILNYHSKYKVKGPGIITGRSGTIGNVFYIEEDFWPHNTSLWVTDFKMNYPKFIYYIYNFIKLQKFNAGTGVPTLNRNDVHKFTIPVTNVVTEQQKIAQILSIWDRAIELKEKLINEKKEYKKGLMQNLLSGKIRLPGFEEKWEKTNVGEVLDFVRKEPIKNPQDYYLLTVKLHVKGIEATNKKPNVTEKGRPYFLREPNELLIGRQNFHNGGIGIVPENMKGFVASNAISSMYAKKGLLKFYFYYFANENFYKKIEHIIGGTGQKEISETMIKKLKIVIPKDLKEQQAIVNILSTADKEIKLLEEELEALKQQKRGLMQLLLTGIVRVN
ncbi:hypothetical protein Q428_13795 [Fervidicella metallireducens AeB]|uniref:Type I restriction modification DNA specificity domain-containing protein n=1 Tax=Fervidicella metallireducens AeB TaxID=1403537 RepID=A0A017RTW5_9CLOT|nr:restriction endonuclease subunit S [Fervidicella metallireducens]EYE87345.1 hypothetical protein Q428_13795 [Fervidicella metallireducens AeB]